MRTKNKNCNQLIISNKKDVSQYKLKMVVNVIFVIYISLTLIVGCTSKDDMFLSSSEQLQFNIGDTTGTEVLFFKQDELYYSDVAEHKYISSCELEEPFYIEKTKKERNLNKRFFYYHEHLYRSESKEQKLILERFSFTKSIDLKTDISISGEKRYGHKSYEIYSLDTLGSRWLRRRNQLKYDSLDYEILRDAEICGTARSELLREGFPDRNTTYLDEETALKIIKDLKK